MLIQKRIGKTRIIAYFAIIAVMVSASVFFLFKIFGSKGYVGQKFEFYSNFIGNKAGESSSAQSAKIDIVGILADKKFQALQGVAPLKNIDSEKIGKKNPFKPENYDQ